MLDFESFPPNAMRLAAACMVYGFTVPLLMKTPPEDVALFAAQHCGLTLDEFLAVVDWLTLFMETHPPVGMRAN